MAINPSEYLEIFTPDNAISSIEAFAGRQPQIDLLADALQTAGTHIVIYGNRGVGKSSVARQLEALATSDPDTLARLTHKPLRKPDFLPVRFAADDSIVDIQTLLVRLLQSNKALAPWLPLEVKQTTSKLAGNLEASFAGIKAGIGGGKEAVVAKPQIQQEIVGHFQNACDAVAESGVTRDGLLLIIDEFDRIKEKSGFASLIKAAEGSRVRFAIVGVARDIEELVSDHASINRQIAGGSVLIPPMSEAEIEQIFVKAHERMEGSVVFSGEAIEYICSCARGHPYIVHLIGRQALIKAVRRGEKSITPAAAREALKEISAPGSSIPLELDYRRAVKNSPAREFILKTFARQEVEPIRTTEVYEYISRNAPIEKEAISVYMGHLCGAEFGPVLEKTGERYYRFVNSVFKAYASARDYELPRISEVG